ncbi:MAG: hypothetical protein GYA36_19310 [Veillonellaceae bacterium]|nr:hypothetical protein [Veillonellaceae bacterium]
MEVEPYDVFLGTITRGDIRSENGELYLSVVFPRPNDRASIYVRARPGGGPKGLSGTGWFVQDGEDRWRVPPGWVSEEQLMEVLFVGGNSAWWTSWAVQIEGPFVDPNPISARNITFILTNVQQMTSESFLRMIASIGFERPPVGPYFDMSSVSTPAERGELGYRMIEINAPISVMLTPGESVVIGIDGTEYRGMLVSIERDSRVTLMIKDDQEEQKPASAPPRVAARKIDTED